MKHPKQQQSNRIVWLVVTLVSGYILFQLIADVTSAKVMQIGPWTLPGGSLVFAITFTWRDMLHKQLGKRWAQAVIVAAAVCNLVMAGYFLLIIRLPGAPFWMGQDAFSSTLSVVWRITLASIVAEVISELVDTEAYHRLSSRFTGRDQWLRVLGSNAVSLPLDSLVFVTLAFVGTMPFSGLLDLVVGQIVFKALVTLVSLPLIYAVPEKQAVPALALSGD